MKKESKIYLFKDRQDYIKKITEDNIYNITGEKGSGKSYFGNGKDNLEECVVIHLDPVFTVEGNPKHDYSTEVRNLLLDNFGSPLLPDKYFEEKYYPIIVDYLKNSQKEGYIEGGSLAEIKDISQIKGVVIVKRTGVFKCFLRVLKRDYHNEYFMKEAIQKYGKLGKFMRLKNVIKRRKKIFKTYHEIEKFIERLELY